MRGDQERLRLSVDRDRYAYGGRFGMHERDKPCRRRSFVAAIARAPGHGCIALPRDTDVTEPAEVVDDLVQPRLRICRLVEAGNDRLHEFACQPDDALI